MDLSTINEMINCLKTIMRSPEKINIPLAGDEKRLELKSSIFYFWVDINRKGRIKSRCTLQLREQQHKDRPLLRLDLVGRPHPNPPGDYPLAGEVIACPHLHIADPDYGISVAYPLDDKYANMYMTEEELSDMIILLKKFLKRCNVGNIDDYTYEYQPELL